MAEDTEEALKRKEMELEERRKQSHDLVAESIRRELAESQGFSNIHLAITHAPSQRRKKNRYRTLMIQMG